jgi:aldehyde dehydrogenase (NAD+)
MTGLPTTDVAEIPTIVKRLRESARSGLMRSEDARRAQLGQLKRMLEENEERFTAALRSDLGKSDIEAYVTEIGFTVSEVDEALRNLGWWMKPEKAKLPLKFRPGAARIVPQPLGMVLIIAPWNYPLQLTLSPLVGALAAGNTVVLKPSEVAPATSSALAELIPRYLDERVVHVVEGSVDETTALLQEQFDHIFYTGNGTVGRIVMRAAAEHLTPVTLELGGKSPAIVAADADLDVAARRITWGKFTNAGQTCIAPDYVLVAADVEDRFLGALLRNVHDFYGENPKVSDDYGRIVNERHYDRLAGLLDAGGFEAVVTGGVGNRDDRYLSPTVLAGVEPTAAVMQDEIFGPILPVIAVRDVDEAIQFVNDRPHPLALYVFSDDEATADRVLDNTHSGGAGVNLTLLHIAPTSLPFGGVGPSGMGGYHGKHSFDTFSHRRSVLTKPVKPDPGIAYPPYKSWKQKILRRVM